MGGPELVIMRFQEKMRRRAHCVASFEQWLIGFYRNVR